MTPLLDLINEANDIKKIAPEQYTQLAAELRRFLVTKVSRTGGHLASNLGAVELTMALHLFLNFPEDKLIWDVGHQAYVHKILTGRKNAFSTLRCLDGLSGFPKSKESACDAFATGHSSTSISAALGMVKARELRKSNERIVAVIGDGALSGGMAFEALNNAGRLKSNMIIVLNDNDMSISENVGAMANYLGKIRTSQTYSKMKENLEEILNRISKSQRVTKFLKRTKDSVKHLLVSGMLFENFGITYIGPIDGHNIERMRYAFELAAQKENAVIVHVVTKKGKGYDPAEKNPVKFHGIGKFDAKTGETVKTKDRTYTDIFGETLTELAAEDTSLCAVTAAMMNGTGLTGFADKYPERFFDVGIAEEHAVTFAAGLAAGGYHPVVAVYSTFLQRAYDQVIHDVCLEQLPVIFAVDRNGIVGNDGETHQGIFSHSFLGHIPGLTVMEPRDDLELKMMLSYAASLDKPCAICYPRGAAQCAETQNSFWPQEHSMIASGKAEVLYDGGTDCVLMALGTTVHTACEIKDMLSSQGIGVTVLNMRFVAPVDTETIIRYGNRAKMVVTLEENVKRGGFGEKVAGILYDSCDNRPEYMSVALPDDFLEQGTIEELRLRTGIDAASVAERIMKRF